MAVSYGYLCEDAALEQFIDKVLLVLGPKTKCKSFDRSEKFCSTFKATSGKNRGEIIRAFPEAARRARVEFDLGLVIAAFDYDKSTNLATYEALIKQKKDELRIQTRNRSVFCLPVQCVEYWLWYVKHADDADKPGEACLEGNPEFTRHIAKSDVYERPLENGKYPGRSNEWELGKAAEILKKLDVDKLSALSPSFSNFLNQVSAFCNDFA